MKNFKGLRIAALIGLVSCLIGACDNSPQLENPNDLLVKEVAAIDQYLDQQGITAVKHIRGVRIQILKLGTGFPAGENSTIDVDYTGRLFSNGSLFDDGNVTGLLTSTIFGWQYAFTSLPAGSEAIIYIPSFHAYGKAGKGSIPPDATLAFEVTFNKVVRTSSELQKLASDTVAIDTYLAEKNIDAVKDSTGLRYVITQAGIGDFPTWYDKVKFKTSYRLPANDTSIVFQFDQQPDETTHNLVIDQLADGLKWGLQKMRVGSKATLYVPSGLGFGTKGARVGNEIIPPNSNIIIDVELTGIVTP